ncbi:DUF6175 family protein [Chitinophaga niabensis]|uniref:Uncharacterized protein n=1 Tax=Chitinophaga niabensis TaxID=536979 RepID=A0A1N6K3M9_9BACT|nr:DUF6175 family protein [Chitinophaga niabensis]SIO51043.1 hypothetical protein SAMN04488055_4994 [Chitinophaga niabensis]
MQKTLAVFFLSFITSLGVAQTQPRIMVIPFTKEGEDIRTVLDEDVNRRIAITKVKEGFDNKGYTTVDFIGKLKAAKDNQLFNSDNQTDIKTKIIEMSGCDIYVITEVDGKKDNSGSSVNVILSSYEVSTGNSLSNKVGSSGKFFTDDIGRLASKAVEKCIDEFTETMNAKFTEIEKKGRSLLIDISFAEGAAVNMTSPIGTDKTALSDLLEEWVSNNTVNSNYHIQGVTSSKIIFDEVKIPLRDKNGNSVSTTRYALQLSNYLRSVGLTPSKEIKGSTLYITLN